MKSPKSLGFALRGVSERAIELTMTSVAILAVIHAPGKNLTASSGVTDGASVGQTRPADTGMAHPGIEQQEQAHQVSTAERFRH